MKKTTVAIFSIIALMAISMFTSCQKHKTELYSCDMNLHNWAAHAREANAGISRDELAKLGIDSQFAVFRSLSNDARLNIYHQKIALALSTETFSDAEK